MSYCRFSTDDFQSDVYCYGYTSGGFVIHLAANRFIFKEPLPNPIPFSDKDFETWRERYQTIIRMVDEADREKITLPYAGELFHEENIKDTYNRLLELQKIGYRVPALALERLKFEMEEENESSEGRA